MAAAAFLAAGTLMHPLAAQSASPDRALGAAASTDTVEFSLHLPLRNDAELDDLMTAQVAQGSPFYHHWLTPVQFRASFGPDATTVRALIKTLAAGGLTAAQTSTQMLTVRGSAATVGRLFSTELVRFANARTGRVRIAAASTYAVPGAIAQSGAIVVICTRPIRYGRNTARSAASGAAFRRTVTARSVRIGRTISSRRISFRPIRR